MKALFLSLNNLKYIKTQCIFKYQLIKLNNLKNQPYICHVIRKRVFRHMWTANAQLVDCADAQPDQGLHCLLTDSLDTAKCMNRDQRPRWDCMQGNWKMSLRAHNVDAMFLRRRLPVGVNPYILHMFKGTFLAWRSCHKFNNAIWNRIIVNTYCKAVNSTPEIK